MVTSWYQTDHVCKTTTNSWNEYFLLVEIGYLSTKHEIILSQCVCVWPIQLLCHCRCSATWALQWRGKWWSQCPLKSLPFRIIRGPLLQWNSIILPTNKEICGLISSMVDKLCTDQFETKPTDTKRSRTIKRSSLYDYIHVAAARGLNVPFIKRVRFRCLAELKALSRGVSWLSEQKLRWWSQFL